MAEPIPASTRKPLPCWNVLSGYAGTIVVVNPIRRWLLRFVDRMKRRCGRHLSSPIAYLHASIGRVYACDTTTASHQGDFFVKSRRYKENFPSSLDSDFRSFLADGDDSGRIAAPVRDRTAGSAALPARCSRLAKSAQPHLPLPGSALVRADAERCVRLSTGGEQSGESPDTGKEGTKPRDDEK